MGRVAHTLMIALMVLSIPFSTVARADDSSCLGAWVGTGQNTGIPSSWGITLTLTAPPAGERCGTIQYTSPTCGGFLEECRWEGQDIHARESYTHGFDDCADPGTVIVRCEEDHMRFSWLGWERVETTLHRPKAGDNTRIPSADDDRPSSPSQAVSDAPVDRPIVGEVEAGCGAGCSSVGPPSLRPSQLESALVFFVVGGGLRRRRGSTKR